MDEEYKPRLSYLPMYTSVRIDGEEQAKCFGGWLIKKVGPTISASPRLGMSTIRPFELRSATHVERHPVVSREPVQYFPPQRR